MTDKEIMMSLRCCAKGIGHDDACENCKVGEIQDRREYIEFAAANVIERLTAENADLRKEIEWKDMVITLAQRKQAEAEAERDALREKQRWIPVTERLPDDDATVLTYKNGILEVQKYEKGRNGWSCNGWFWSMANVTHWMPLPEAPEEGGKHE